MDIMLGGLEARLPWNGVKCSIHLHPNAHSSKGETRCRYQISLAFLLRNFDFLTLLLQSGFNSKF